MIHENISATHMGNKVHSRKMFNKEKTETKQTETEN